MNSGLLSVDEALARLLDGATAVPDLEQVPALEATGRVLAQAQVSALEVPPMDNSAMDGYALRLADLTAPGMRLKVTQRIAAGSVGVPLAPGTAARIFTGAPGPPGAAAVVVQGICSADRADGAATRATVPGPGRRACASGMPGSGLRSVPGRCRWAGACGWFFSSPVTSW